MKSEWIQAVGTFSGRDIDKLHIPLYVGHSTYFVADDTLQKRVHPFYLNK